MKSYTDLEQSKKLAEILPLESADMYWDYDIQKHEPYPMIMDDQFDDTCIPAWSLAVLLGALQIYTTPTAFSTNISVPSLTRTMDGYSITYTGDYRIMDLNNGIESPVKIIADNPVDACVEMIEKLHEFNLL